MILSLTLSVLGLDVTLTVIYPGNLFYIKLLRSFLEIWILSFNPAQCNFIPTPKSEMEFYPLIQTKVEFHPFIQKERYPLNKLLQ